MGEIQVEGGPDTSITDWISKRSGTLGETEDEEQPDGPNGQQPNGHLSDDDSGLSSVGDRLDRDDEMDLT